MLLTGAVEANDLAQGAPRRVTQCLWSGHTTLQLRGGHGTLYHWATVLPDAGWKNSTMSS